MARSFPFTEPDGSVHADEPGSVQFEIGVTVWAAPDADLDELVTDTRRALLRTVNPYGRWTAPLHQIRSALDHERLPFDDAGSADPARRHHFDTGEENETAWEERARDLLDVVSAGAWTTISDLAAAAGVPAQGKISPGKRLSEMLSREFRSRSRNMWASQDARADHLTGLHRILSEDGRITERQRRAPDYVGRSDFISDVPAITLSVSEEDPGVFTGVAVIELQIGIPVSAADPGKLQELVAQRAGVLTGGKLTWDITGSQVINRFETRPA